MRAPTREDLEAWVTRYQADITERGSIVGYALMHTVEGEPIEQLATVGNVDGKTPENITGELWDTAKLDTNTRTSGVPQRYVVHAYRGDPEAADEDNDESIERDADGQFAFSLTSTSPLARGMRGGSTEPPNERGLLTQLMRQSEETHRQLINYSESVAGRLSRELDRTKAENDKLHGERMGVFTQMQALMDKNFERELKREEHKADSARKEQMMNMLMSLAPLLLSKLIGTNNSSQVVGALTGHVEESNPARDIAIGQFLQSLDGDELSKILEVIGPDKATVILSIYDSYKKSATTQEGVH